MTDLIIAGRKVGPGHPSYIIAELSANHLKRLDIAVELVRKAAKAKVDAFKIQTLTPDTMTIDCDLDHFIIKGGTNWDGRTYYDLYSETPLPYEWHQPIWDECQRLGLTVFSTPYDKTSVDFLDQFDVPAYKIASFEIFDLELIQYAASRMKPMLISTGLAELEDMAEVVEACRSVGNEQIALLKCTSSYPAPSDQINLRTMADMATHFGVVVGVSDHTLEHEVALASICLGGSIIEKHMCLDRSMGGPDAEFSIEPNEMEDLVSKARNTETILGSVRYDLPEGSKKNLKFARSLFFIRPLEVGETVTKSDVRSIRPGFGIKPKYLEKVIGQTLKVAVKRGTPVTWEVFQ